ncbi:MAG: ABC transporter ATP-binding protein [Rhodospirillaceae bacterium]|nr:ABC transporter ATP-binding protein [Rhodospirillaceae bacterium]
MAPLIQAQGLHKTFRIYANPFHRLREAVFPRGPVRHEKVEALVDVSFSLAKGETVGIVGRNGSGKSTLLNLITGILRPTAGTLAIQGTVQALLELGAGFDPLMTGRDNVLFQMRTLGLHPDERMDRLPRIEAFADIGAFFDRPVQTYSSGMFARLAFASAIQGDPDILILDEILAVGDASFQEKCFHHIHGMREKGTTILFVSHDTDQVSRLCRSALLLDQGRLLLQGPTRDVIDVYHGILHGARRRTDSPQGPGDGLPAPGDQTSATALETFRRSDTPLLESRSYYNRSERRITNGAALVTDILLSADGAFDIATLGGQETLCVYLKVAYARAIPRPHVGWGITTRDGVMISGSNTLLSDIALPPASAGETVIYRVDFPIRLVSGDYFLNLGINTSEPEWTFLETRRAVIHLPVRGSNRCTGFLDAPMTCTVLSDAES